MDSSHGPAHTVDTHTLLGSIHSEILKRTDHKNQTIVGKARVEHKVVSIQRYAVIATPTKLIISREGYIVSVREKKAGKTPSIKIHFFCPKSFLDHKETIPISDINKNQVAFDIARTIDTLVPSSWQ